MILSGAEITRQISLGNITINPFDINQINPNSYNYRLGEFFRELHPDASLGNNRITNPMLRIPRGGRRIEPGKVYLCHTLEVIGSSRFVASLIGRSSIGRLGLFLQLAADLGNLGPAHRWTLELTCVQPIIIYSGMIIGQISFWVPSGSFKPYEGRYTDHSQPMGNLYNFGDNVGDDSNGA